MGDTRGDGYWITNLLDRGSKKQLVFHVIVTVVNNAFTSNGKKNHEVKQCQK